MKNKKVRILVSKRAFLDWRFCIEEDTIDYMEGLLNILRKEDEMYSISLSVNDILENTTYIPSTIIQNKKDIPEDLKCNTSRDFFEVWVVDFSKVEIIWK